MNSGALAGGSTSSHSSFDRMLLLVVPLLAGWFRIAPHEAPDHDGHLLGEPA